MCNLYSITTNQAAIIALFRVINRYVGNLPPMPGVFPDYPAPATRSTDHGTELAMSGACRSPAASTRAVPAATTNHAAATLLTKERLKGVIGDPL
jgi:putative SOS response-associated peptidase YedK